MQPLPAPEPYTLPLTMRVSRRTFITHSVIFLPIIAFFLWLIAFEDQPGNIVEWMICFGFVGGFLFLYLNGITNEVRLTEERISYRQWHSWREMEYSRITAVRFYFQPTEIATLPILELKGDSGVPITINLGLFDRTVNHFIIYDVLKKRARRVDLSKSPEDFFIDPAATAGCGNVLPGPYTLPLTLRMDRISIIIWSVLCLGVIAATLYFGVYLSPPPNIATWVFFFLITAFFLFVYLVSILPAIRLTEDKISYRERFSWKEMEYQRITAVRYYYPEMWSAGDSGPVLELSDDTGNKITMSFGTILSPEHLPVIYDVLKMKATRAGLHNSPGVFFSHPDTTTGS